MRRHAGALRFATFSRCWSRPMPDQSTHTPGHQMLAPYTTPRLARSLVDVGTSVVPYLGLMALVYITLGTSFLLTAALILLAAGFQVRTFVVFHDCAHGSLFRSKR